MGYLGYSVLFALIISLVMIILSATRFGQSRKQSRHLIKIMVPEDISYTDTLEPIISQFANSFELVRIKTVELGSLYELTYRISLLAEAQPRVMIDMLRCHNSNLAISLSVDSTGDVAWC
jgi:hypothetical protein